MIRRALVALGLFAGCALVTDGTARAQECRTCWTEACPDLASYAPSCREAKPTGPSECITCWTAHCPGFASYYPRCAAGQAPPLLSTAHESSRTTVTKDTPPPAPPPAPPAPSPVPSGADACRERSPRVHVELPVKIVDGAKVEARIRSSCDAYLIVFFREEDGQGAMLWPSEIEAAPRVTPGEPATLLSRRERARGERLVATLRDPRTPAFEMLIVYAIRRRDLFERVRPQAGADESAEKRLARALEGEPSVDWNRTAASYVIEPRRGAR